MTHMFTMLSRPVGRAIMGLTLAALFVGCSSIIPPATQDPTRYYILDASTPPPTAEREKSVGVRPIELPGYLRNARSLVLKAGDNEVRFMDYHRWAEPLETGIGRVVRERLAAKLSPGMVLAAPFSSEARRDADVSIRVIRCEGDPAAGRSVFVASYVITPAPGKEGNPISKHFEAPAQSWDGSDYAALSKALSVSIEALADQIASDLP